MESDRWVAWREMFNVSRGDPVRDKIALVDDKDDLFVRLLLTDVLENAFAQRTQGVPRVQYVEDDVGRVDDLVQLTIDSTRRALSVDGFDSVRICREFNTRGRCSGICGRIRRTLRQTDGERTSRTVPVSFLLCCFGSSASGLSKLLESTDVQSGLLALGFRSKRIVERLGFNYV